MTSAELDHIRILHDRTGVSLSICKRVLVQTAGDLERALFALKSQGEVRDCPACGGSGRWIDPILSAITRCEACQGTGLNRIETTGKQPIGRELLEKIITYMAELPPRTNEADPHVVEEVKAMVARGLETYTDPEIYDAVQRIGDREVMCEISSFVSSLCDLKRYYVRPE